MVKRTRKRFILLTMAALLATLLLTFGCVFLIVQRNVAREADTVISLIAQNRGGLPSAAEFHAVGLNEETRYSSRYYAIWTDKAGNFLASNLQHITLSTASQIEAQMREIFVGGKSTGYVDICRFGVYEWNADPQTFMVIVLDRSTSLRTVETLSIGMGITAGAVMVLVFLLLLWLSRYAVRPFEQNQERQRRFITDAGHELKTPIAIISSNAEVLEMTGGENKWITNIREQTQRISQLVGSMIELSRMDEEKEMEEPRQLLDLSELVTRTVESFSAVAEMRALHIQTDIMPNVRVMGYLEDMTRLAGILLDNAVKYTDDRAYLRVALTGRGKKAQLVVENTCTGMDVNALPHLFDRFYRADESRSRATGGSGIGLSMAQMLVSRQKGKLSVQYFEDGLIRFTAEL